MDSILQLETFVFSFIFGVVFYLLSKFNFYIVKNKSIVIKFSISLIYVIDMVLLYFYFNYKLNNGVFHLYFLLTIIIGYIFMTHYYNKICKIYVKIKKNNKI